MNLQQIQDRLNILTEYVLTKDELLRLGLEYGWGASKIGQIYNIMQHFEQMPEQNFSYEDVENAFLEIGIDYQMIKSLFLIFYSRWIYIKTIKVYLQTNYKTFGNVSGEYVDMYNELFLKTDK